MHSVVYLTFIKHLLCAPDLDTEESQPDVDS